MDSLHTSMNAHLNNETSEQKYQHHPAQMHAEAPESMKDIWNVLPEPEYSQEHRFLSPTERPVSIPMQRPNPQPIYSEQPPRAVPAVPNFYSMAPKSYPSASAQASMTSTPIYEHLNRMRAALAEIKSHFGFYPAVIQQVERLNNRLHQLPNLNSEVSYFSPNELEGLLYPWYVESILRFKHILGLLGDCYTKRNEFIRHIVNELEQTEAGIDTTSIQHIVINTYQPIQLTLYNLIQHFASLLQECEQEQTRQHRAFTANRQLLP